MPNYQELHFNTAQELWDAICPENIGNLISNNTHPIYRGQGDSSWILSPNASRGVGNVTYREQVKFEVQLLIHFLNYCDNAGIQVPGHISNTRDNLDKILNGSNVEDLFKWPTSDYYQILAFAQHFGVSTRLLDWSKRSFIAAYFSSSEAVKIITNKITNDKNIDWSENLAIWILESKNINKINNNLSPREEDETQFNLNIVNVPSGVNFHIAAQQGCFTLFRDVLDLSQDDPNNFLQPPKFSKDNTLDNTSMEYSKYLHKWTLSYSEAHKLLNLCELYNINAASVYPTATGVGYAVKDLINVQIIEKYLEKITDAA